MILGIDGGLDGGLVMLNDAGQVVDARIMPTINVRDGKREYDEQALCKHLKCATSAFLETAQAMPGQGVSSMFSIGKGYGLMRGILAALQVPYTLVHPKTWQKVMFADLPKQDTKALSVIVAGRLWPGQDWRPSERCRKAHNGMTDAALIAMYGVRVGGGMSKEMRESFHDGSAGR